jgi:class 3 adenylate cyclase
MVVPDIVSRQLESHITVNKLTGETTLQGDVLIASQHEDVALCFIDICDFTVISSALSPGDVVRFLHEFFTLLDRLSALYPRVTKIKTVGDAYFAIAGLDDGQNEKLIHPRVMSAGTAGHGRRFNDSLSDRTTTDECSNLLSILGFCLDVMEAVEQHRFQVTTKPRVSDTNHDMESISSEQYAQNALHNVLQDDGTLKIKLHIGVHCGNVIAGVVGEKRPQYDVWGTACNLVARMESSAPNGTLQMSAASHKVLADNGLEGLLKLTPRHPSIKGFSNVVAYTTTNVSVCEEQSINDSSDELDVV